MFFRDLTLTIIIVDDNIRLQESIHEILCKFEGIFPSRFFYSMEHLPIHVPYEGNDLQGQSNNDGCILMKVT